MELFFDDVLSAILQILNDLGVQLVVQLVEHEQDEADGRENGGNQIHDDVHGGQGARGLRGSAFRIAVGGEHGEPASSGRWRRRASA